jgi:acylphosphatase
MQRECRRVYFSGRVQGVGFRFTSQQIARGFDVDGYVRNLPDGRVELVAEGHPAEVDGFLAAIRDVMRAYIRGEAVEPCPSSELPLSGFTVRH